MGCVLTIQRSRTRERIIAIYSPSQLHSPTITWNDFQKKQSVVDFINKHHEMPVGNCHGKIAYCLHDAVFHFPQMNCFIVDIWANGISFESTTPVDFRYFYKECGTTPSYMVMKCNGHCTVGFYKEGELFIYDPILAFDEPLRVSEYLLMIIPGNPSNIFHVNVSSVKIHVPKVESILQIRNALTFHTGYWEKVPMESKQYRIISPSSGK